MYEQKFTPGTPSRTLSYASVSQPGIKHVFAFMLLLMLSLSIGQLFAQTSFYGSKEIDLSLTDQAGLIILLEPAWAAAHPDGNFQVWLTAEKDVIKGVFTDENLDPTTDLGVVGDAIIDDGSGNQYRFRFEHCGGGVLVVILDN